MIMRLTLEALTVLEAIDRKGSFAAAADELHRVPSAITYAIQKLEEDLGVLLFDRSGHRASLTDAGRELLREGRQLLQAATEIESRVKRVATGYEVELRIAVDDIIPKERLYPLLQDFYREACGTRLRLLTEVYGGAWDALVTGRADLVLGAPGEGPAGGGYSMRPLGTVEWQFMVAQDHAELDDQVTEVRRLLILSFLVLGAGLLLMAFIQHPGRVLNRDQLLDLAKGRSAAPLDRTIDLQVSRLRRKIEEDARNPEIIKTIWGDGYIFAPAHDVEGDVPLENMLAFVEVLQAQPGYRDESAPAAPGAARRALVSKGRALVWSRL